MRAMNRPLHVLIVGIGGVTRVFRHWPERVLALALTRRGHRVWAIGTHDPTHPALATRHEWIEGVEVIRVPSSYWPNRELTRTLRLIPHPDVVHLMHPRNVLAAQVTRWARRRAIPTVYTWLGPFHDAYATPDRERPFEVQPTYERLAFTWGQMLKQVWREYRPRDALRNYRLHWPLYAATALAPCSEFEANVMRQFGLMQPIVVVPLWLDPVAISAMPTVGTSVPLPDLPRPWLLFVGQLTPRKGYDLAIRALAEVVTVFPSASLLIVSGINQAQREQVLALATTLGVAHHVHILGYLPDETLHALYRTSDVFLFPTRYEGFGLPLLEAMAAGCPLVASDIPVIDEIVYHEYNGLLFPYGDSRALGQSILRLLQDQALRERLRAGGMATIRERYQEETLVTRLLTLYDQVGEQVGSGRSHH